MINLTLNFYFFTYRNIDTMNLPIISVVALSCILVVTASPLVSRPHNSHDSSESNSGESSEEQLHQKLPSTTTRRPTTTTRSTSTTRPTSTTTRPTTSAQIVTTSTTTSRPIVNSLTDILNGNCPSGMVFSALAGDCVSVFGGGSGIGR